MATIMDLLEAVERFDPMSEVLDSFAISSDRAVVMNIEQLLRGKTSEGADVAPEYSMFEYSFFKQKLNNSPNFGTPDLRLTGDFHKGFNVRQDQLENGIFEIDSSDYKTSALTDKYGESIFGLNTENTNSFLDVVIDKFAQKVLDQMGLIMENV